MFKKIMAAMLVCVLLTCYATSAFAYSIRYCSTCNANKRFYDGCSGIFKDNSAYIQHEVGSDGRVCNYYLKYYKNKQNCVTCGNKYDPNTKHLEAEIHDICGGKARCPF